MGYRTKEIINKQPLIWGQRKAGYSKAGCYLVIFLALRLVRACGLLRTLCKIAGVKGLLYYLLMCLCVWVCSQKPKEGAGSLGAEVTVSCKLLDMSARSQQVLSG